MSMLIHDELLVAAKGGASAVVMPVLRFSPQQLRFGSVAGSFPYGCKMCLACGVEGCT